MARKYDYILISAAAASMLAASTLGQNIPVSVTNHLAYRGQAGSRPHRANRLTEVYRFYGQEPTLSFMQQGDGSTKLESIRTPGGAWDKSQGLEENQHRAPALRLSQVQRASKLMGTPVQNLQNEKLGKVENLSLDLAAGRVVAFIFIVSTGDFFGERKSGAGAGRAQA